MAIFTCGLPLQIGRKSPAHMLASLHNDYTTQKVGFSQHSFNHRDLNQLDRGVLPTHF